MTIRRTKDSDGATKYLISPWVAHTALTIALAWVTAITWVSWGNSVLLGEGPRFTSYDAAIMNSSIAQLRSEILDCVILIEACNEKIEADRDRRAEILATFTLLRRELMDHAREDDRRFGAWLHTLPGEAPAGELIGPWIRAEDSEE